MTWMKVDDGLGQHRKVLSIPRIIRKSCIGVWTLAGSWASANLTDGFVPAYYLDEISADQIEVDALVKSGLWEVVEEGYQFHDWLDANPSKEQVLADRKAAAERQKRARERAAEKRRAEQSRRDGYGDEDPPEHDGDEPSRRDSHRSSVEVTVPPARPDPARPDPKREEDRGTASSQATQPATTRGTRIPEDWQPSNELKHQMIKECPDVDTQFEHKQFVDHFIGASGAKGLKRDWPATWRRWMREEQKKINNNRRKPFGAPGHAQGHIDLDAPANVPPPRSDPFAAHRVSGIPA